MRERAKRKTWFVLDELASLQRLPQLTTAVTENRKSNNPMVLGFQGKAQVEALYGHVAEAMLSQPATKIFLKTSEPSCVGVDLESYRRSGDRAVPRDADAWAVPAWAGTRRASSGTSRVSRW